MEKRQPYPSDMTEEEWMILDPLIPAAKVGGRPRKYERREVVNPDTGVNAIRYLLWSECSWRMLPHEFPPYRLVFHYFRTWRRDGTWERIHDHLPDQVRQKEGRMVSPSAGVMDSQSVKTTEKGAERH